MDEGALTIFEDGTTVPDNLRDEAYAEEHYGFAFQGGLWTLDHVLVTRALAGKVHESH